MDFIALSKSKRGKDKLCLNGFMFNLNKRRNNTFYWECIQRKHLKCSDIICKGKATTKSTSDGEMQIISHTEHSHVPKPENLYLKKTRYNIKEKAATSNAKPCEILQDKLTLLGPVDELLSPNLPSNHAQVPKPENIYLKKTRYNIEEKAASSNAKPREFLQDKLTPISPVDELLSPNMPSKPVIGRVRAKIIPRDRNTLAKTSVPDEAKVSINGNYVL